MVTIKEQANATEKIVFNGIETLGKVSVDLEIEETTGLKNQDGKEFSVFKTKIEGIKYRVPKSVLIQLKNLLDLNDDIKFFKVGKSGEGLKTQYSVLALPNE